MKILPLLLLCFPLHSAASVDKEESNKGNLTRYNNIYLHGGLENTDVPIKHCQRRAKCEQLNYSTCMGVKLPYYSTTLNLTDLTSQEKVQEQLNIFQYFRYVPKCWAVIQPFLCALYMPKCENDKVNLLSKEMCERTLQPCKIFYENGIFPKFLNCNEDAIFRSSCENDVHEFNEEMKKLKFNTTGACLDPLVKTDNQDWFYPDVEGCGLRCKDSLYSEGEHYQIHKLIGYCVFVCCLFNLFTVVTFFIDWNTANKYPALTIFYMNVCFFISYVGWSIQFLNSETREDIVCKKDGTLRKSEPSATENLSCVIVFVLVYYFLIAGMVWFVLFSYTWHMSSLQALGKIQERVDKKRAYFHLIAWSLPLMLTITTMALGEIDGDYVTGICFVGMVTFPAKAGLLLAPLAAAMVVAGYIIIRGLILLIKVKIDSKEIISEQSSRKIRYNIVRMGVFTLFMVVFCVITFIYHGYLFINSSIWSLSLQRFILCKLTSLSNDFSHCKQEARPSVAMLQLQLLVVFGAGIAMASWVWCEATLHSWARYVRKKFRCEVEEPTKLQKHKIIAQAFAMRKKFNQSGRISIDCQNYTDPVGLNFDLNSAPSDHFSQSWAENIPRFVNRRGAMQMNHEIGYSSNNQSVDSEVSVSVRHVSIESRCNSGDSQLSVQISELTATRKVKRRHRNRMKRKDRRLSKMEKKRESSASLDSHLQLINALTRNCDGKSLGPDLNKRRPGNAGLDGQLINKLLSNGKLVIPYSRNAKSASEDENVSVAVSENRFNVVLSNTNLDLTDQLAMQSLRKGINIQELSDSTDSDEEAFKQLEERHSRSGRDSRLSRKSRRSKKSVKKYDTNSDSFNEENLQSDSSCVEIKQLLS